MEPATSTGSKGSLQARRAEFEMRFGKNAIERLTAHATRKEVQGALSALQVVVAKTFAAVLYKSTGRELPGLQDDLGLTEYFLQQQITREELQVWLEEAQATEFAHTAYSPLPSKAQAVALFRRVREKLFDRSRAAEEIRESMMSAPALPAKQFTRAAALHAVEFGVCGMLTEEHRQRICELLEWEELGEEMQRYFFSILPEAKRREILTGDDRKRRKAETAKEHEKWRRKS